MDRLMDAVMLVLRHGRRQQIRVVDSPTPTPISSILHSARKALKEAWLYFRLERAVAETCCAPLSTLGTQLALVYSSQTHVPWFTLRKVVCCVWPSVVDEALLWSPLGHTVLVLGPAGPSTNTRSPHAQPTTTMTSAT